MSLDTEITASLYHSGLGIELEIRTRISEEGDGSKDDCVLLIDALTDRAEEVFEEMEDEKNGDLDWSAVPPDIGKISMKDMEPRWKTPVNDILEEEAMKEIEREAIKTANYIWSAAAKAAVKTVNSLLDEDDGPLSDEKEAGKEKAKRPEFAWVPPITIYPCRECGCFPHTWSGTDYRGSDTESIGCKNQDCSLQQSIHGPAGTNPKECHHNLCEKWNLLNEPGIPGCTSNSDKKEGFVQPDGKIWPGPENGPFSDE